MRWFTVAACFFRMGAWLRSRAGLAHAFSLVGLQETARRIPDSRAGFLESWRGYEAGAQKNPALKSKP